MLPFTPGADIERLEIADPDTNNLPVSWDLVLTLLFAAEEETDAVSNRASSSEMEKGRTSSFKRRPQNFPPSQDLSLACCACTSPAHLHPGHTVGMQLISQLQSLSSCLLELARFTVSQPVLGTRQPLWPQPLPSLVRCVALPPSWFQWHIFTRTSLTHPATDHFQSDGKYSTNFL